MKTLKIGLSTLVLLGLMAGFTAQAQSDDPVPPEYQALYNALSAQLDSAEAFLGAQTSSATATPTFGAELLPANGNRGDALLNRTTLPATIQYLDQLQALGVGGVTLDIKLPVLLDDYPRSADYLAFYRQVVAAVRNRGMKLLIESGPAFSGTIFSTIEYDYSGMTASEYFQKRIDMLATIATALQPDYLAIGAEVSTEEMLTKMTFSASDFAAFVHQAALKIREANPNVKIGSGIGVWENPAELQPLLADSGLDYIGLHIYPLAVRDRDLVQVTFNLANQIKAAGKQVIIGEAWLYKAAPADLSGLGNDFTELYSRDVYSFWSPLDVRFIKLFSDMARLQGYAYVSFYWSTYFFGYVTYSDFPKGTSPANLFAQANRIAYANLVEGILSPTGKAYQQAIMTPVTPVASGDYTFTLQYGGLTRYYRVYVPNSYSASQKTPVVIYLHGGGGSMQAAYRDGMAAYSDKYGFILLVPQGTGSRAGRYTWNAGATTADGVTEQGVGNPSVDDVGFIAKVITDIERRYNIDSGRIYATGLSNGAAMSSRLGCDLSETIAAIAPVAGALEDACHPARPVPAMLIHGTGDPCHPYEGGTAACARGILTFKVHHMQSAADIASRWASLDECSVATSVTYQNGGAACVTHASCGGGAAVSLCTVTDMGHTYPSGNQYLPVRFVGPVSHDISFDQIWEFFEKYSIE